ncbi:PilZ domain-containing protein [Dissulfurirhabdus thermomarina]|uniref:PilZ domain-containing protein n=1 Tax=Dissulfurirhabdus thermomarina TaxID=1765737 RepID=A0A6N9TU29_DISTH|nr:PilZ domain-containing protein [Dissulfurirhabdus thermomarina]NDY43603.1 PilZ domain-containing protein [Dissulfurirhabdus thermomarina]NMX22705.1 PilZ domain-containing protein [Dissulfurirhabdus thermomarina]
MKGNARDNRRNVRVPFRRSVVLRALEGELEPIESDRTRDISLRGVYCYCDRRFPVGTACEVELRLSGTSSELSLRIEGEVARVDEEGLAVAFRGMDLDSLFHLKNILYYNTGRPELIDEELAASP